MLCTGAAKSDVIQEYHDITGATHKETLNDLEKFLKPLIEVGVIYEKETPPVIPSVKTQFSVSTTAETIASVVIEPTCACNYHCTHCYTDASLT